MHISLSTWLRDYLYIPLGGNRNGEWATYRNLFLTMLLGGIWHGAAWTFVLWGAYHGFLLSAHRFLKGRLAGWPQLIPRFLRRSWFYLRVVLFFHVTCFGWLIFRAQNFKQIGQMSAALFHGWEGVSAYQVFRVLNELIPYIWFLMVVQLYQFVKKDLMIIYKSHVLIKGVFYFLCLTLFIIFGVSGAKEFIYFQF